MCLLLNDFPDHDHSISTLTIQRDYGTFLWEVFYNNSGTFLKRCSTVVQENSKRFVLDQF